MDDFFGYKEFEDNKFWYKRASKDKFFRLFNYVNFYTIDYDDYTEYLIKRNTDANSGTVYGREYKNKKYYIQRAWWVS